MDIVCAGILVADILSSPIESLPNAGELRLADRITMNIGGCAANAAMDLVRLGRSVRVVGKVGRDLFGDFVVEVLKGDGIDVSGVKRSATDQTSATQIVNVRGQDRRFIHTLGANADFSLADIDLSVLDGARLLYLGGYLLMPRFTAEDVSQLFQEAKRRGLITVLDVVVPADKKIAMEEALAGILPYTDAFLPNDDEGRALTGQADPRAQAEAFASLNPACTVVITRGRHGVLAKRGAEVIEAGIYQVESIDGSGAGDAFDAGFFAGLLEGWPLEDTVRFAAAIGASCTRALGTTAGVFTFDEAVTFIEQNPLAIKRL
jgi:sugar/nucleoside kinase (ribokinase family)